MLIAPSFPDTVVVGPRTESTQYYTVSHRPLYESKSCSETLANVVAFRSLLLRFVCSLQQRNHLCWPAQGSKDVFSNTDPS
jgi:hypothetical protein